jgi:hypothetical protein
MSDPDEMFVGDNLPDDSIRYLRRLGLGFLLATVFLPLDLLALVLVGAGGVYFCIRAVHRLAA